MSSSLHVWSQGYFNTNLWTIQVMISVQKFAISYLQHAIKKITQITSLTYKITHSDGYLLFQGKKYHFAFLFHENSTDVILRCKMLY